MLSVRDLPKRRGRQKSFTGELVSESKGMYRVLSKKQKPCCRRCSKLYAPCGNRAIFSITNREESFCAVPSRCDDVGDPAIVVNERVLCIALRNPILSVGSRPGQSRPLRRRSLLIADIAGWC